MRILFAAAPAYGLLLPIVPLVWAARAAGHEAVLATTSEMAGVAADAGLTVVDVHPDREVWGRLMGAIGHPERLAAGSSDEFVVAAGERAPFAMFSAAMSAGTIEAARAVEADLLVYTSDHGAGLIAAAATGVRSLEVGNRLSWSTRDQTVRDRPIAFGTDRLEAPLRARLGVDADRRPDLIARVDPRPPSMGGLAADQTDTADGVPWWSMRYVPYNGGTVVPGWALETPARPRIGVTLGTVVPTLGRGHGLGVILDALGDLDVEVVLAAGRADLSEFVLPVNVRSVGYLPLSAFVPRCSVLVHHGGSGTMAAPLAYGVPQLVLPAFADNPLSAERVVARGVGLAHDPASADAPTVRALVQRLLDDPSFAVAAREVAAEMAGQPSPASVLERAVTAG